MVRLYIENREVELDNTVQFAITKQFEDLTNPTDVINDWSKTVSIPFSKNNNELFGHIYNPDKVIIDGGTVGIYFNPLLKLDFRLVWNEAIIMTGYAKMNTVKQVNGKGTYEITLFGQLGKIFQEMQKITFDTTSDLTDYIIDGSQYLDEEIDKSLVYQSWTSIGQTHMNLMTKDNPYYTFTDILGFVPNNSFNDGFDYKTYQKDVVNSGTFEDALGDEFTAETGIKPDTAIPDGLLPREIGEYRSYLQLPYIYWNKLFKIFQAKAEAVTNYTFDLDGTWFSVSNPYWYNLVYMLKPFNIKDGETYENNYYTHPYSSAGWTKTSSTNTLTTHRTTNISFDNINYENVPMVNTGVTFNDGEWNIPGNSKVILNMDVEAQIVDMLSTSNTTLNNSNALVVILKAVDSNNAIINTSKVLIKNSGCTIEEQDAGVIIVSGSTKAGSAQQFYMPFYMSISNTNDTPMAIRFRVESYWKNSNWPTTGGGSSGTYSVDLSMSSFYNPALYIKINRNAFHSGSEFTLNDLWNNDYNLFDEILKYCKMYHIGVFTDDATKKIKFVSLEHYFSGYTIVDWTDKIDKSKDYIIKPITFENKYVLFNYADNETMLGEKYKEKYGVNYGEFRLVTDYNFNESTVELFKNIPCSITNTDNILSWTNLFNNHKITYSFPAEVYVYCKDDDKKYVDTFGRFYFHNGLANFSTEAALFLRSVHISDDTALQGSTNTYFYNQLEDDMIQVSTYPKLDIIYGDNMCVFNIPKENYTYVPNYDGKNTIYTNFWQKYLNERYNIQNKQITCYVHLKPIDYINFEFKKFIKIGNQLCMVNKIYDYDITSNGTTKVDFITIQDVSGYTTNNYTV